ncbi:MAG TPA: class I SAM-dependent methyltransferase [Flavisolibacter sp.]|nr:class I SAM-dependent methyltransferase [Flavisolibacter sp.]
MSLNRDVHISSFEALYLALRQKEQWLYRDEQVRLLPNITPSDPHYKDWQVRRRSSLWLATTLRRKRRPLDILEVGCGNGWLSARLKELPDTLVTGLDINHTEIEQARRVFGNRSGLCFIEGDLDSELLGHAFFDVIVFAASLQYFDSARDVIAKAIQKLKRGGEIHILDTRFYERKELEGARHRSADYFSKMGFEAMESFYFHHTLDELDQFSPRILYDPASLFNRLRWKRHPFHWLCISPGVKNQVKKNMV